ncbi:MAG: hypothetical protein PHX79_05490 [Sphaerochaetaceae bacterium]|nr:hypothetical protein [Sphaerochaetaceae bacterium]
MRRVRISPTRQEEYTVWKEIANKCHMFQWEHADLANIMGYSVSNIGNLLNGRLAMTLELADRLADIFGETRDYWIKRSLESDALRIEHRSASKEKRLARWYRLLPIRELAKIGWLCSDNDPDVISEDLREIMDHKSYLILLDYTLPKDPRRPWLSQTQRDNLSPLGMLWIHRAKWISMSDPECPHSQQKMQQLVDRIHLFDRGQNGVEQFLQQLIAAGVKIVKVGGPKRSTIEIAVFFKDDTAILAIQDLAFNPYLFWTYFHGMAIILTKYRLSTQQSNTEDTELVLVKPSPNYYALGGNQRVYYMGNIVDMQYMRKHENDHLERPLSRSDIVINNEERWAFLSPKNIDRGFQYADLIKESIVLIPEGMYCE